MERILIVDDDALVRRAMQRSLSRFFDVTVVECARSALDLFDAGERFEVVLCDLNLGDGFSGHDLYDRLTVRDPSVALRMIITSGATPTEEHEAFGRMLGERWVVKPVGPLDLIALIQHVASPLARSA